MNRKTVNPMPPHAKSTSDCTGTLPAVGEATDRCRTASVTDPEDLRLIDETLQGDLHAFGQLASKYRNRLVNSMTHLVQDHAEAEDVAQDALMQSYVKLCTFRRQSAFYTWLYRIAVNRVWSIKRRQRHEVPLEDANQVSSMHAPSDTPSRQIESEEQRRMVQEALKEIYQKHREVLVLRHIEGYSYVTISEILEIPLGTVRSRIHRGRLELRQHLMVANGKYFSR